MAVSPGSEAGAAIERTLILGGVRSGKSRLAERLARASGRAVTYVATATPSDDEMRARIAAHRERRPRDWNLVEEPLRLATVLESVCAPNRCVLVECLTLWLANLIWHPDPERMDLELRTLDERLPELPGQLILVGNEVNMGVIAVDALTRRYCDRAGELHQRLGAVCDRVVLTVAGLPLVIKGEPL
jgi:adenosylcobinamide kinase/adenosylcobinamide-phosphate guanylyltransferase